MIKVNKLVAETLKTLGVPICRGHYRGEERDWIRYELTGTEAAVYHDGTTSGRIFHYLAWVSSRGTPDELALRAADALKEAGFYAISMEDAGYEEISGFNRIAIEFRYLEMAE